MTDSSDRDQSQFNMAVSYLNRLNTLFYLADDAAMNLDVNTWLHSLKTIYRELSTETKPEETTKLETAFNQINVMVQSYNHDQSRTGKAKVSTELYDKLHNTEITIRSILKKSGLLMKMRADAGAAIEDL